MLLVCEFYCFLCNYKAPEPTEVESNRVSDGNRNVLHNSGIKERMQYIKKCYDETVQAQREFPVLYKTTVSHIMLV